MSGYAPALVAHESDASVMIGSDGREDDRIFYPEEDDTIFMLVCIAFVHKGCRDTTSSCMMSLAGARREAASHASIIPRTLALFFVDLSTLGGFSSWLETTCGI